MKQVDTLVTFSIASLPWEISLWAKGEGKKTYWETVRTLTLALIIFLRN